MASSKINRDLVAKLTVFQHLDVANNDLINVGNRIRGTGVQCLQHATIVCGIYPNISMYNFRKAKYDLVRRTRNVIILGADVTCSNVKYIVGLAV